jgi:hypothetical protein
VQHDGAGQNYLILTEHLTLIKDLMRARADPAYESLKYLPFGNPGNNANF